MEKRHSKSNVIKSLIWKLLERIGTQGVQFLVQIFLARLLLPKDFGTIALVMVFISLGRVFVERGFNTALIQKKNPDNLDFSSVFYISFFLSVLLYFVIYMATPYIADFYGDDKLSSILRVLSLTLLLGSINSIQYAYISKNMLFKKLFTSSFVAIVVSGTLGIAAAYMGAGVWALVIQQLSNQLIVMVILWFTLKWRPILAFSIGRVKTLFSFGWKLLASSILNTLYLDIRTLIIGRLYSPSILGYYNRGEQFPRIIVINIDGAVQSVMLPTFSAHQDNPKIVKDMVRRTIKSSSFLIFPIMVGMIVVAEPLVRIVLTEKWLPAVPFLQLFCISYAVIPIHTANAQAINALGRSDIFLKLEVIKKIIGLSLLVISIRWGVYAIAISMVISSIISSFINAYPNKDLLKYSIKEQWIDIIPSLIISSIMGVMVYLVKYLVEDTLILLISQILLGIITYVALAKIFKNESYTYIYKSFGEVILV